MADPSVGLLSHGDTKAPSLLTHGNRFRTLVRVSRHHARDFRSRGNHFRGFATRIFAGTPSPSFGIQPRSLGNRSRSRGNRSLTFAAAFPADDALPKLRDSAAKLGES